MRAKRVMSANLTGTKTQGNRCHVDELDDELDSRIAFSIGKL